MKTTRSSSVRSSDPPALTETTPLLRWLLSVGLFWGIFAFSTAQGTELDPTFSSASDVGLTSNGYSTAADTLGTITLNYAPMAGTNLTLVNNTGLGFIDGTFSNLAQGQAVALSFGGNSYNFVANYYGGTGNDLVLQWASIKPVAWGQGDSGQLGNNSNADSLVPAAVSTAGVLAGKTVVAVAAGHVDSVALCSDGTLATWGNNSAAINLVPVAVDASGVLLGKTVIAVTAGWAHHLALCSDGTLAAWGDNTYGQLGDGTTTSSLVPVAVDVSNALSGKTVVAVAAGKYHTLALCSDGTLVAWGYNLDGELGNSAITTTGAPVFFAAPVFVDLVPGLASKAVVAIAAGDQHSVALCSDGTVAAWGDNTYGELGNNSATASSTPVLVTTAATPLAGKIVKSLAAGGNHTVAVCTDGTLVAWGRNQVGQLGNNSLVDSPVPVAVNTSGALSGLTVVAVAAGDGHSVALCADGTEAAWGDNTHGQLGNNSTTPSQVPVTVNASLLSAGARFLIGASGQGASHNLGFVALPPAPAISVQQPAGVHLITDSSVVDLGSTPVGTDLTQTFTIVNTGTAPLTLSGVTVDGANASEFTPASPLSSSLAVGASTTFTVTFNTAVALSGRSATLHIASNDAAVSVFDVGITGTGIGTLPATYTTGQEVPLTTASLDATGSLANLTLNFAPQPGTTLTVVNNTGTGFINGSFSNLAQGQVVSLTFNGVIYKFVVNYYGGTGNDLVLQWAHSLPVAWGNNAEGEFGDGDTTNSSVPVLTTTSGALAGKTVIKLGAGTAHSVALCSDGTLATWGTNINGELGNNGISDSLVPVAVDTSGVLAGKTVIAIAVGNSHTLALCSDNTLVAWGNGVDGELGNNSTASSGVPVAVNTSGVLAGRTIVAVAAGASHSLALCSDGTLAAWGSNVRGQLGNGGTAASLVPVAVSKLGALAGKTVVAIAGGAQHTLALCSDGTPVAWGFNVNGQLGNNSNISSPLPVAVNVAGVLASRTVVALAAGQRHSLALCSDGRVASWGFNSSGQLGNNSNTASTVPVLVDSSGVLSGETVVAIAAGAQYSLAQCSDGTLVGWGDNTDGELGDSTTNQTNVPVQVDTLPLPSDSVLATLTTGSGAFHSLGILGLVPTPQIALEQPAGTPLASGDTVDFGSQAPGTPVALTFTLKNIGDAPLTISGTTIDGLDSTDFVVTTPPSASVAAESSTTFAVTFSSSTAFNRTATLHVMSDDPGLGSFDVNLTGSVTGTLSASFSSATDVPATFDGFVAAGSSATIALNFAPAQGAVLTLVDNTGTAPVTGTFTNLAQGQDIALSFSGTTYHFLVSYFGGTGNDIVLRRVVPAISLEQPAGTALTSFVVGPPPVTGSTVDFGSTAVGNTTVKTFTASNTGETALTVSNITIDGVSAALYKVSNTLLDGTPVTVLPASPVLVPPGSALTFDVTFKPIAVLAARVAALHVASTDPNRAIFTVNLTAAGTVPLFTLQPVSLLLPLGQPASFTAAATPAPLTYKWYKATTFLTGQTTTTYSIPTTVMLSAAAYTLKATNSFGTGSSLPANLGIVNTAPSSKTVVSPATISLAAVAAGPGITYQWFKDGSSLANGKNPNNALSAISGATAGTLAITKSVGADAGVYSCLITMPNPGDPTHPLTLSTGNFTVSVTVKPVLNAFIPSTWIVGGNIADVVTAQVSPIPFAVATPTAFTVVGGPAGVTMNASGHFVGKPTVAILVQTTYHLTITASNAAGAGVAVKADVFVQPLQTNAVGTFNGLVDRDATLSSGFGGTLNVIVANTGVFSGKLALGALAPYAFTAQKLDAVVGANASGTVAIVRKLPLHNLTIQFTINITTGELTGTVNDTATSGVIAPPVPLDAWRNPWNGTTSKAPLAAVYNSELDLAAAHENDPAFPQGTGFVSLTISTAGGATWVGKMADGQATGFSTTMAPGGLVPLHFMLNASTGSAHGWVTASAATVLNNNLRVLDGTIDWVKNLQAVTSTDHTYKAGIALNTLTVTGAEYIKPATGVRVPGFANTTNNAKLTFSSANLEGSATYLNAPQGGGAGDKTKSLDGLVFTIPTTNVPLMPTGTNNVATVKMAIVSGTGAFSGSFVLKNDSDPTKPTTPLTRTTLYYGLLVPRVNVTPGVGFFLLSQPPANATGGTPKTTLATSPVLSGQVILETAP